MAYTPIFTNCSTTLLTLYHYNFYYSLCQTTNITLSSQFLIFSSNIFLFHHFIPPIISKKDCTSLNLFAHLHPILVLILYFQLCQFCPVQYFFFFLQTTFQFIHNYLLLTNHRKNGDPQTRNSPFLMRSKKIFLKDLTFGTTCRIQSYVSTVADVHRSSAI